ncbi:unnamed protein product [Gordionus sp. m RMFG-2023]
MFSALQKIGKLNLTGLYSNINDENKKLISYENDVNLSKSTKHTYEFTYQRSFERELGFITSLLALPIYKSDGNHWTAIFVGFASGYLKVIKDDGNDLFMLKFDEMPIVNIKINTRFNNDIHSQPVENKISSQSQLLILHQNCIITIEDYHLYQTLQLAKSRSNKGELTMFLTELANDEIPHRKLWLKGNQQNIDDIAICGRNLLSTFDQLRLISSYEAFRSVVPPSGNFNLYVISGEKPYLGFYYLEEDETGNQILNKNISNQIVLAKSKIKGGKLVANTSKLANTLSEATNKVISRLTLGNIYLRFGLMDVSRKGTRLYISPDLKYIAICDNLGRISILDVRLSHIIYMLKGYREAFCSWCHCRKDKNVTQRDIKIYPANTNIEKYFLVLYAPRRGLIEIWHVDSIFIHRVEALNVCKNGQLIKMHNFQLGMENKDNNGLKNHYLECVLIEPDGSLKSINVDPASLLKNNHVTGLSSKLIATLKAKNIAEMVNFLNSFSNIESLKQIFFCLMQNCSYVMPDDAMLEKVFSILLTKIKTLKGNSEKSEEFESFNQDVSRYFGLYLIMKRVLNEKSVIISSISSPKIKFDRMAMKTLLKTLDLTDRDEIVDIVSFLQTMHPKMIIKQSLKKLDRDFTRSIRDLNNLSHYLALSPTAHYDNLSNTHVNLTDPFDFDNHGSAFISLTENLALNILGKFFMTNFAHDKKDFSNQTNEETLRSFLLGHNLDLEELPIWKKRVVILYWIYCVNQPMDSMDVLSSWIKNYFSLQEITEIEYKYLFSQLRKTSLLMNGFIFAILLIEDFDKYNSKINVNEVKRLVEKYLLLIYLQYLQIYIFTNNKGDDQSNKIEEIDSKLTIKNLESCRNSLAFVVTKLSRWLAIYHIHPSKLVNLSLGLPFDFGSANRLFLPLKTLSVKKVKRPDPVLVYSNLLVYACKSTLPFYSHKDNEFLACIIREIMLYYIGRNYFLMWLNDGESENLPIPLNLSFDFDEKHDTKLSYLIRCLVCHMSIVEYPILCINILTELWKSHLSRLHFTFITSLDNVNILDDKFCLNSVGFNRKESSTIFGIIGIMLHTICQSCEDHIEINDKQVETVSILTAIGLKIEMDIDSVRIKFYRNLSFVIQALSYFDMELIQPKYLFPSKMYQLLNMKKIDFSDGKKTIYTDDLPLTQDNDDLASNINKQFIRQFIKHLIPLIKPPSSTHNEEYDYLTRSTSLVELFLKDFEWSFHHWLLVFNNVWCQDWSPFINSQKMILYLVSYVYAKNQDFVIDQILKIFSANDQLITCHMMNIVGIRVINYLEDIDDATYNALTNKFSLQIQMWLESLDPTYEDIEDFNPSTLQDIIVMLRKIIEILPEGHSSSQMASRLIQIF